MSFNFIRIAAISAGILVLSACATTQTPQTQPAAPPPPPQAKMPMMKAQGDHTAMSAKMMENMPQECKAMMSKMHEKMKAGGMDMAAMKAKMKSGEGMSEQQKKCRTMMHDNMHKAKAGGHGKHQAMKEKHGKMMENMPQECKSMMSKMHEKMKAGGMDMAAMKAKMKSGEGMSEQQKKCHSIMKENMKHSMHKADAANANNEKDTIGDDASADLPASAGHNH